MGLELAYVAVEFVYPPFVGSRHRAFVSSGPLAEHAGSVAVIFHYFREDDMSGVIWVLSYYGVFIVVAIFHHRHIAPIFLIAPYLTVSRVLSGHKRSARWSADRASRISLCKAHAFGCHIVDMRSTDVFLAIATQITIPHVVTHYIYDIGFGGSRRFAFLRPSRYGCNTQSHQDCAF